MAYPTSCHWYGLYLRCEFSSSSCNFFGAFCIDCKICDCLSRFWTQSRAWFLFKGISDFFGVIQEMNSILEYIPKPDKKESATMKKSSDDSEAMIGNESITDQEEKAAEPPQKMRRVQTFVFSATLTLPESLRKRLRKGKLLLLCSICGYRLHLIIIIFILCKIVFCSVCTRMQRAVSPLWWYSDFFKTNSNESINFGFLLALRFWLASTTHLYRSVLSYQTSSLECWIIAKSSAFLKEQFYLTLLSHFV